MPNVFTCDPGWLEKLKASQEKVVIAGWCGDDEKCNQWLEKLAKLEEEGIPVFIIDKDSCPAIAEKIQVTEPGQTVVFVHGEEKGRLTPSGNNLENDLETVRELTK